MLGESRTKKKKGRLKSIKRNTVRFTNFETEKIQGGFVEDQKVQIHFVSDAKRSKGFVCRIELYWMSAPT